MVFKIYTKQRIDIVYSIFSGICVIDFIIYIFYG